MRSFFNIPNQSWWKIDGQILKSTVFNDGDI